METSPTISRLRIQPETAYVDLLSCEGKDCQTEQQEKKVLELIKSHKQNAYGFCSGTFGWSWTS